MNSTPDLWSDVHDGRYVALLELIERAGARTLDFFQTSAFHVERKQDNSPVTEADREAEQLVRDFIAQRYPGDGLLGEEFGSRGEGGGYRWIVDPIDGTKSFIAGVPLYSTLLALECDGEVIAGAIAIPALGELAVAAKGRGAWYRNAKTGWTRCQVSRRGTMRDAIFVTSQVDSFDKHGGREPFERLQRECWITRTWGDAYGYLLVATGRADVMVDPVVNPWDIAAVMPVILEAGGAFSDWRGETRLESQNAVGTNGLLHAEVLKRLGA